MIFKDRPDSPPCYLPSKQLVTFVFSQPQNTKPFYLAELFTQKEPEYGPHDSKLESVLRNVQMHQVDISIGKKPVCYHVPTAEIIAFLRRRPMRGFVTTNFFLSPVKLNMLLDRATGNFLEDGGSAQSTESGILFARDLRPDEIIYLIVMSRTPVNMTNVDFRLGRR